MSTTIEALKEKARRHEQDEEWRMALDLYQRAIHRLEAEDRPDIGLHNRVGDLYTRVGDSDSAVEHYETAVDLYDDAGLSNNAIAVCKKIVRNVPTMHRVFLRMGLIRARQGFVVDARHHFLTYAERMKAEGDLDEALRALVEFADLVPDDTEIRLAIASQFEQHSRTDEAAQQVGLAYQAAVRAGDDDQVADIAERLRGLDPEADLDELARTADRGGPLETASFSTEELGGEPVSVVPEVDEDETLDEEEGLAGLEGFDISVSGGDDAPEEVEPDEEPEDVEAEAEEDLLAAAFEAVGTEAPAPTDSDLDGEDEADDELEVGSSLPYMSFDDDEEGEDEVEGPAELPFLSGTEELTPPVEPSGPVASSEAELEAAASWTEPDTEPAEPEDTPEEAAEPAEDSTTTVEEASDVAGAPAAAVEEAVEESRSEEGAEAEAEPVAEADEDEVARAQRRVEEAFRGGSDERLVDAYQGLAEALERSGAAERARGVYQQILGIDPDHTAARRAVEVADSRTTEDEAPPEVASSEDYVDLGALILGEDAEKTTRFVVAYEEPSGDEDADFAKMLSQFKEKVDANVDSSDVKAHHDLGVAYREMGLLDEAIEQFQKALRASGAHLPTYEALGQAFLDKEAWAPAIRVLTRALDAPWEVEDELLGIYYYLGRAHEAQGNTAHAVEFYDRVFSLDINFADVTERLRVLR